MVSAAELICFPNIGKLRSLIIGFFIIQFANFGGNLVDCARLKRVIEGSPVLDIKNTDYLATRYFVWIGNGHNCDTPLPDFVSELIGKPKNFAFRFIKGIIYDLVGRICAPGPQHLLCTGSLLTPFVVQTACHCVAVFNRRIRPELTSFVEPIKKNAYESGYTVHPAKKFVDEIQTNEGVYSKEFVIHPKCKIENEYSVHDYALIVLHSSFHYYQQEYAPIYPIANLAKMWIDTMANAKICLMIGFGSYKSIYGERYQEDIKATSTVLRHGWGVALGYRDCYDKFDGYYLKNYTEEATFLCTESLPYRPYQEILKSGSGDSGGPVTCDNQYVAIVSEGWYRRQGVFPYEYYPEVGYDKRMSTAFSVYENSIEYRAELNYRIYELYDYDDPLKNFRVTFAPIVVFDGGTLSSGVLSTESLIYHYFSAIILLIASKYLSRF
ncbi:hypothetical protein GE061_006450 [Apolygus lucorum]|uniref:Peptidase S1 domain-containing protein n=1 Tax=Apolygus lucorum TaxID=248454 RepID=A0A8S9WVA2_APOLU|nr:hypothetical protein GE061_006450 [Apolygus lucorum]